HSADDHSSSSSAPAGHARKNAKEEPDCSSEVAVLTTPRQVTPSVVDVSSSDRLHLLSRSESALPLSSTTAYARQAHIDSVSVSRDSAYIAAVKRAYKQINLRKVDRVTPMPFSATANRTDAAQQLTRSIKRALTDIL
ncbi:unnamed protein product, partial [Laminaria digitata]